MSQDDRPPPKHFDDGDPAKMRPIERRAVVATGDLEDARLLADIANSRAQLWRTSTGWMLLGAAKAVEHVGVAISAIYDERDRQAIDPQLRGLYRLLMGALNAIRQVYGCEPINATLPAQEKPAEVEHGDR